MYFSLYGGFGSFSSLFSNKIPMCCSSVLLLRSIVTNLSLHTLQMWNIFVLYRQVLFEKCVSVYASSNHSWLQGFVQKEEPFFFLWLPGCYFLGVWSFSLCFVTLLGVLKIFLTFLFIIILPWLVLPQYCEYSAIIFHMHKPNPKPYVLPKAGEFIVLGFIFSGFHCLSIFHRVLEVSTENWVQYITADLTLGVGLH